MCRSLKGFTHLALVLIFFVVFGLACSGVSHDAPVSFTPQQLEGEAQDIDENLICPSCPGKTIGQAQVEQAAQMRLLVREKLAEGWSRQQVLDYFAERYEGVLAEPPKQGFTLLVWLLPLAGMIAGAGVLYLVLRAMRRRPEPQAPDSDLDRYLGLVDRDLASSPPAQAGTPPSDTGDL